MIKKLDKLVVGDPGHGGHDPGAVNRKSGISEAPMALDVMLRFKRILEPFVNVALTRDSDRFLTLGQRPRMANRMSADLFVSYHFNSAASSKTLRSFEGYTTPGQNNSDRLATLCLDYHGRLFPGQKLRADRRDGDPDKEANFAVLRPTRCPSFLMEGEFIHTTHGAALIKDPANRERMAMAMALGCLDYLGHTEAVDHLLIESGLMAPVVTVTPPAERRSLEERVRDLEEQVFGFQKG